MPSSRHSPPGDLAAVKRILVETPSPCVVNPQGITSPPRCPDGVAGGTLLPVFRATAGEAVWPSELDQVLQNSIPIEHWLYGVYRTDSYVRTDSYGDSWIPASEYGVIVGDETRSRMAAYFITASGVVGARFMGWAAGQGSIALLPLRPSSLPPTPTPTPPLPVASSAIASWYPPDTFFQMTDLFDLQRIPFVEANGWPTVATVDGSLSARHPPAWTASSSTLNGGGAVQIRKPLLAGQIVAECRTVPGYVYADLNADPTPVSVSTAGGTIVRDVLVRVMTNGMTVRVIQAANICGTDQGDLVLVAQAPFQGQLYLNGAVAVHFPATAEDIGTAFAIIGSVAIK